ncbi:PREDICTED: craniofacial development protein 1-like [Amphimedon queenslandica]|uniref:Craniofacial development protein 1 n=1 Tax=Amphimedon queenslandica TaxID=400682 RepID=A0A1X7U580_AMPQE|nr:PREDICTED: craniofacial development protein 1-like [Amphimedon queenslandica]|eukprot:XP_019856037.1 PREDICTED: craniofacial development protein 1-like [Amphimedon queenslandica]
MADEKEPESDSDDEYCPNEKELKEYEEESAKLMRKRKGPALSEVVDDLLEEEEGVGQGEGPERGVEDEDTKKNRLDEVWMNFKKETTSTRTTNRKETNKQIEEKTEVSSVPMETIKIKKSFDFAGEEVIVEKEVPVQSNEAVQFIKSTEKSNRPSVGGVRRSGGAKALLASLNKKPKLSTLEKSKLDWDSYKKDEGLEDELTYQTKDGYLDRQSFLSRADVRQFEIERDERLKRFKRLN